MRITAAIPEAHYLRIYKVKYGKRLLVGGVIEFDTSTLKYKTLEGTWEQAHSYELKIPSR